MNAVSYTHLDVYKRQVCHYTYEVNGLRGLDRVADLRAALSGMSGSLNMSGDSLRCV